MTTCTTKRYYSLAGTTVAMRDSATGQLHYTLGDQLGSTTVSVNAAGGTPVVQRYLPYGAPRSTTGGSAVTDRGWIGQTRDNSTGLQYLNARYYDPAVGRFTSPDPVVNTSRASGSDAYGYGAGNPVTLSDPSGLDPDTASWARNGYCGPTSTQMCGGGSSPPASSTPPPGQPPTGVQIGPGDVANFFEGASDEALRNPGLWNFVAEEAWMASYSDRVVVMVVTEDGVLIFYREVRATAPIAIQLGLRPTNAGRLVGGIAFAAKSAGYGLAALDVANATTSAWNSTQGEPLVVRVVVAGDAAARETSGAAGSIVLATKAAGACGAATGNPLVAGGCGVVGGVAGEMAGTWAYDQARDFAVDAGRDTIDGFREMDARGWDFWNWDSLRFG